MRSPRTGNAGAKSQKAQGTKEHTESNLPLRPDQDIRAQLANVIAFLIDVYDGLDGDPDREVEDEHDEENGDREPSLGSTNPIIGNGQDHGIWAAGGDDDREGDPLDQGELEHDGREPDEDGEPDLGWCPANPFEVDCEGTGYVPSKADAAIRRKLKAPHKRDLSNVSIEPAVTGRSRVRLPDGRVLR